MAVALILVVSLVIVFSLSVIPSSAVTGGSQTTVCNLQMTVTGNYEDVLFEHWIGNFAFSYSVSGCHTEALLDLLSPPQFNLFPFTLTFTATLTDSSGVNHCKSSGGGVCDISSSIPAAQTSYPFQASTTVSNIPVSVYTLNLQSPFPINSYNGQTSYSEQVTVSQS